MRSKPKVNYLSNKILLEEIHRVKRDYCSFVEDGDGDYHHIVQTILPNEAWVKDDESIPKSFKISVEEALVTVDVEDLLASENAKIEKGNSKIKAANRGLAATKAEPLAPLLQRDDLVVRVMTFEHVPTDEKVRRVNKTTGERHPTMSFPPFKHFRLVDGQWVEVCRSHWVGGFDNGHFENRSGRISPMLAQTFVLLVDRIARRGNFSGYSYLDEMKSDALMALIERGLTFNEARSDNPFAFYTTAVNNAFKRRLVDEKKVQTFRDDILEEAGFEPSSSRQAANDRDRGEPLIVKRKPGRPRKAA